MDFNIEYFPLKNISSNDQTDVMECFADNDCAGFVFYVSFFLLKERFIVTSHGNNCRYKGNNINTMHSIEIGIIRL